MLINRGNLDILYTSYNTAYRNGLTGMQASSQWMQVAADIPSTASEEKYGWLGKLAGLRKWVGERQVHSLAQHDFAIANEDFELTYGVPRNDIEDDKYGVYGTVFSGFGEAVAGHPDELVFDLLKNGFDRACYDGQYFFDTDHPVVGADGTVGTVSNSGGGAGAGWYLIDDRMSMRKPLIFQRRKSADNLVRRDMEDDEPVWKRNEFEYGVHCRDNAGYGWWQTAYGSKQDLDAGNYHEARKALIGMKGDYGRPLGLMPNKLIVPPALEDKAREVLKAERNAQGATNIWMGTAEVVVVPWLA